MELNPCIYALSLILIFISAGIRIVRPTQRGLTERLEKYHRFANPRFHLIIPYIEKMYKIKITESMIDAQPQEIVTNDNLNARADAQIYFRLKRDEENLKNSIYKVNNYVNQIVNLARTTL